MPDAAYELAALRAGRTRRVAGADVEATRQAAAALGHRLVDVGTTTSDRRFVLGWLDGAEPSLPATCSPFGGCRRYRWSRWPSASASAGATATGRPTRASPLSSSRSSGSAPSSARHARTSSARSAHDLSLGGLVVIDDQMVRLGPAVAAWTPAQVDALRRFGDVLPEGQAR